MSIQPRSYQVVPASEQRFLDKALSRPADRLLFDLEDGVADSAKDDGRERLAEFLSGITDAEQSLSVRINPWDTAWTFRDVLTVVGKAGSRIDTLVLPKALGPSHVSALDLLLTQVELEAGLEVGRIGIEPQIESASAVASVHEICVSSPRVQTLILGPLDLTASLSLPDARDRTGLALDPLAVIGVTLLVAARTHGIGLVDGPFFDLEDPDGLVTAAAAAAGAGYDGKWAIHPSQIEPINQAFTPTAEQIERAQATVAAVEAAAAVNRGAARAGTDMVDEASRKVALAVLARARRAR